MRPDLHSNKLTTAQIAALVHSYQSGTAVKDIETAFGVSKTTIHRYLRLNGVGQALPDGQKMYRRSRANERIALMMAEEAAWAREQRRIARQRTALPQSHGTCAVCGKAIKRGESYGNDGNGPRHLRDCRNKTLEQARRYGSDTEMGNRRVRMAA